MRYHIKPITTAITILIWCSLAAADFVAEDFITGQSFITTVAFSPNGNMYFIEKNSGLIKVVLGPDSVRAEPFFALDVNSQGERGGLGLTFHPSYPDSPYVYCYATIEGPVLANAVIRFIDSLGYGTHPDTIFSAPITVSATNHNGGNLRFGPDGKLYITMGENAEQAWAQDTCRVQGKIIRFNYDGTIPEDNPIHCAPLFAYGLRNSYDFCFHPESGALYASENGPEANDELNLILPGRNYGWPDAQCSSDNPNFEDPIYCWPQVIAPTGIVLAWNSTIPEFNGKLLMTDWNTGTLRTLTLNSAGDSIMAEQEVYDTDFGLVDVEQGTDGNIYLTKHDGTIVRLKGPENLPTPFRLAFPRDNDAVINRLIPFAWERSTDLEGPVSYRFEVSTDSMFASPLYAIENGNKTKAAMRTDTLFTRGRSLFWRVAATDGDGHTVICGSPVPGCRMLRILAPGDVNASGQVDVQDVNFIISYLRNEGPAPNPKAAADINHDCLINGLDVSYLSRYLDGGSAPVRGDCDIIGH